MSSLHIIEKTPMTVVAVKEALDKIKEREEGLELNFRALKAVEYGEDFARIKAKDAKEMFTAIQALDVPRLKDVHITKLIDLMPQSEKSVKVILNSYHLTVSAEQIKKITEVFRDYVAKK